MRFLIFYGHFHPASWFISFRSRDSFLEWIRSTANCCCVAMERIALKVFDHRLKPLFQPQECILFIAHSEQCSDPIYELTLESLILMMFGSPKKKTRQKSKMMLAFMLLLGEQRIGQALKTIAPRLSDTGGELGNKLSKWVAEARAVKMGIHIFGQEMLDSFHPSQLNSYDFRSHGFDLLLSKHTLLLFKESRNFDTYQILVHATIKSTIVAPSLFSFASALYRLGQACEMNGEYRMALKALKKAHRICFMSNGEHIAPTFMKEYTEMRRELEAKLIGMRCGYCARIRSLKLRSCTGCMQVMYCDKSCQKKHWNAEHRDLCSRTWSDHSYYQALKNRLCYVFGVS